MGLFVICFLILFTPTSNAYTVYVHHLLQGTNTAVASMQTVNPPVIVGLFASPEWSYTFSQIAKTKSNTGSYNGTGISAVSVNVTRGGGAAVQGNISNATFNKKIIVNKMRDEKGNVVTDASLVQQLLYLNTDLELKEGDILRKKI